jgi:hypothetical protein
MAPVVGVCVERGPHHQVRLTGEDLLVTPGTAVSLGGALRGHPANHVLLTAPLLARLPHIRQGASRPGCGFCSATVLAWHLTSLGIE